MHWKATTVLICLYGIVKEFRPATPFLTPYLRSSYKNFTNEELYGQIYPFWTYSYLVALESPKFFLYGLYNCTKYECGPRRYDECESDDNELQIKPYNHCVEYSQVRGETLRKIPVFFLTDILRYKPIIVLEALCLCGTWVLLVWGKTLWQMQLMQIIFGISSASEVAYYSYMYSVVDQKYYTRVTSYLRSAALVGKFLAFGLAQFLVTSGYGSYLLLNQISFGACTIIVFIAIALPSIPAKMIARKVGERKVELTENCSNRAPKEYEKESQMSQEETASLHAASLNIEQGIKSYFKAVWNHMKVFKRNKTVLKWSVWWALGSGGMHQVYNYIQTLWSTMQIANEKTNNGLAECANTLIGALLAFFVQYMKINWVKRGEIVLFISSAIASILLFLVSQIETIVVSYVLYVAITGIYHMLITASTANVAAQVNSSSYGLIYAWNTFVALIIQTILTIAVADEHGLSLDIRSQFVVYASFFAIIAVVFLSLLVWMAIRNLINRCSSTNNTSALSP